MTHIRIAFNLKTMTREQEDLLWKDLCTRLPYRVKFKVKY